MSRRRRALAVGTPIVATGLSSASNFAASVLAVLTGTTAEFGAFSFAIAVVLLAVMLTRSALVEPVLATHRSSRALLPLAGLSGVGFGAVVVIGGAVAGDSFGGGVGTALVTVGVALPFLLVQDAGRAALIHAGAARRAVAVELIWLVVGATALGLVAALDHLSPLRVLTVWAGSGVVASLVVLARPSWLPHGTVAEVAGFVRARLVHVLATAVLQRGFAQVATVVSGVILGLVAFGELRASILLLTPLNPVIQAARVLAVKSSGPIGDRVGHARSVYTRLAALILAWAAVTVVVVWAVGPDGRLLRDVDLVVVALIGAAWAVQASGTFVETLYRLEDRYRELAGRYVLSSPAAFVLVVGSSAFGVRAAATGILLAALTRALVLWWARRSPVTVRARPRADAPVVTLPPAPMPIPDASSSVGRVGRQRAEARPLLRRSTPDRRSAWWRRANAPAPGSVSSGGGFEPPTRHAELVLAAVVFAVLRPVRSGLLGQAAELAQLAAVAFAVWDVAKHPATIRQWLSHVYVRVPIALAVVSLVWSVNRDASVTGLLELFAVSAVSIVVMRRLPPTRRVVPIFQGVLAVGLLNLMVFLAGSGAGPRGAFIGLFEQKNGLGRAAFLIAVCALVLNALGQLKTRSVVGALALSALLAVSAKSGTVVILIVGMALVVPPLRQRLRSVEPFQLIAVALSLGAIGFTTWWWTGSASPTQLALRLLGRDLDQNTAEVRRSLWRFVVDAIAERPVLGHGYSTFEIGEVIVWTGTRQTTWLVGQAHNGYLDTAYQLGLVGIGIVLVLQVVLLYRLRQGAADDIGLRPWLIAVGTYTALMAVMNYTYSTFFGRLEVFWLLQSVLAVAAADRIQWGGDDPPEVDDGAMVDVVDDASAVDHAR